MKGGILCSVSVAALEVNFVVAIAVIVVIVIMTVTVTVIATEIVTADVAVDAAANVAVVRLTTNIDIELFKNIPPAWNFGLGVATEKISKKFCARLGAVRCPFKCTWAISLLNAA